MYKNPKPKITLYEMGPLKRSVVIWVLFQIVLWITWHCVFLTLMLGTEVLI